MNRQKLIACALGNQAARDGISVLYKRLSRLLDELAVRGAAAWPPGALAEDPGTRTRGCWILDDWAMVKLTADQRRDLMEVIDDRHDRGSTIVATQIPQDSWHVQIGDPTYAVTRSWIASSTRRTAWSSRASRCAAMVHTGRRRMRLGDEIS